MLLYIDDLDEAIINRVLKFADYTKLVADQLDIEKMQTDLIVLFVVERVAYDYECLMF